ncbi:ISL3 family transposase [Nocardioides sp.]|uniref:ISL3 family transposase n=1 Tax=Nocardioides sp. TaxID=35761 RepID=UPI002EDA9D6E
MRDVSLWRYLLGLEETVIEGVELDWEERVLVVAVRPAARRRGRCGQCRAPAAGYDAGRGRRRWRALDCATIRVYLEANAPRVRCQAHGVVVAHVPWARHRARSTHAFEDQVAWLVTKTSLSTVAELMRVAWRTVNGILARVWEETAARVDLLEGLSRIGIDEVSWRRYQRYLLAVVDHDTGHLVWVGKGNTTATAQSFFDALGPDRCAQITHISADAAPYIAKATAKNCPDAIRVADPFHVVKWANDALGEVRLEIWRETRRIARANSRGRGRPPADADQEFPANQRLKILTRSRYALWKNPENLTEHQQARLDWIAKTDPRLWRAYQLKEGLRAVLRLPLNQAGAALDAWCRSARRCRIPQFVDLARMVADQRGPILAAIEHDLSNAISESVNTRIRLRNRIAFGIKDPDALISLLMLTLSGHAPTLPGRT